VALAVAAPDAVEVPVPNVGAVPEGGLPIQLVLRSGTQRVVFQISEEGKL
jgi:hypothetical protein